MRLETIIAGPQLHQRQQCRQVTVQDAMSLGGAGKRCARVPTPHDVGAAKSVLPRLQHPTKSAPRFGAFQWTTTIGGAMPFEQNRPTPETAKTLKDELTFQQATQAYLGQCRSSPRDLAKFCHYAYLRAMSTMNISLPDALKSFVDEQVAKRGYATSSEYVRELIRADQDRERLRKLLLDGAASKTTAAVDESYFTGLRNRVDQAKSK